MKISRLTITNLLSFRDETTVEFDQHFSILVGPNGGGKSNLLDIVAVVLAHYFLRHVRTYELNEAGRTYVDLALEMAFPHLPSVLETFGGSDLPWDVKWEVIVTEDDLRFIRQAHQNKRHLLVALSRYRNRPVGDLDIIDRWLSLLNLSPGSIVRFETTPTGCAARDPAANVFLQYLNHRELIYRLSKDIPGLTLPTAYLYFSPYRSGTEQNVKANLSGQRFDDLFREYRSATSRNTTSLLPLGTIYFAEKRRRYESLADQAGYNRTWQEDPEVKLVTEYVHRLGYDWDLSLVDANKNIYEILLKKGDHSFRIERASSGEREILGFLLGIFAFNMHGGIVIIDEPELHLHPKWQAVLRDLLLDLSRMTNNQILIATHSPSFITRDNVQRIIRVFKESDGASRIVGNLNKNLPNKKALTHMILSHNNEKMFFADKVVLVEGIKDRLLFSALFELCSRRLNKTEVTEVLEVHGKANFKDYREFLDAIGQKTYIVADLDYIINMDHVPGVDKGKLRTLFSTDYDKMAENVTDNKKSIDRVQLMRVIEEAVNAKDLSKIDLDQLTSLYKHMASRHTKLRPNLTDDDKDLLDRSIEAARGSSIFILKRGEIEDYLPAGFKELAGLIELIRPGPLEEWLSRVDDDPAVAELMEIVFTILNASQDERHSVLTMLCAKREKSDAGFAVRSAECRGRAVI